MKKLYCCLVLSTIVNIHAFASPVTDNQFNRIDSILSLKEVSITAIKQGSNLQNEAISSTTLSSKNIERLNINSTNGISEIVPNFYIPEYGSRMTSSIYVRGLGARIDQPVVGLNVDNIPILNKDNYDFNLLDISRIEMLRGSQSTLFGRNTMGGLINIYTLSPLNYQGLRILAQYSSGNTYQAAVSYYTKINDNLGFSILGSYYSTDGFFKNIYNNENCDWEHSGNGRIKLSWNPGKVKVENTFSFSISRQGGYPYEYVETKEINYNDTCFYRRNNFNDGLTIRWNIKDIEMSSISSFQYLDDNMTLDQDFLPIPYFTLTQSRKEYALTQDLIAKGKVGNKYKWLGGLFGFYKDTDMNAPVTFLDAGIEKLIEHNRNDINPNYPIRWDERELLLNSIFNNTSFGIAAYHQSDYKIGRWKFSAGIRFDYEKSILKYNSNCDSGYTIYKVDDDKSAEVFRNDPVIIDDSGSLSKSFLQILPKFSVLYNLPMQSPSNIFMSISKGYKAGGFNTQMFSDVLQQKIMSIMGLSAKYNVDDIVGYKPEISWTYEVGTHIECLDRKIQTDISLFYIDCTNQQLTVFPDGTTTGRIMTNAGKSRSLGAEIAIKMLPTKHCELNASYGYTNAKFNEFNNGKSDFSGNYVPYAPQNTLFVGTVYTLDINADWLENIIFDANVRGVGRIYWDEANTIAQPFYALLGISVKFAHKKFSLQLWGENITGTKYNTFYFVSMSNAFLQRGNKARFGATLRITI
ncbi:MAG: TonB-dependent receptor [Muribaculaceae bacterium]|nr:TonB-dependent receptor [Muribaculaceae bacterium]